MRATTCPGETQSGGRPDGRAGSPSDDAISDDSRGDAPGRVDGRTPDPAPDGIDDPAAELVRRARDGEREAFGRLYDQYADLIFRYALYRVGGNRMAAEDIVSDTFLRALRAISTFRYQGRDIGAWLITIARNLVIDQTRSPRSRFEFPSADVLDEADIVAVPGPEDAVLATLDVHQLLDAVRRLGPDQQECLVLRFMEGLTVRETAKVMGRKEGAVRALQFRAVRALARELPDAELG